MAKVLYISYDGLLEPLGQSQVWQYVRRLASRHSIVLLTFEKPNDLRDEGAMQRMKDECARHGVEWVSLRYHKAPTLPATAFDVFCGVLFGLQLTRARKIQVVHARSYVAGVMALSIKAIARVRFLFDMRGFWADERVDGGIWPPGSWLYRLAKRCERMLLTRADAIVSLTYAGVSALRSAYGHAIVNARWQVITTCADLSLFTPRSKGGQRPLTLGYVGAVGVWYLFESALAAFQVLREIRPDARFLIVNRGGHQQIRQYLEAAAIPRSVVDLRTAEHHEVPELMHEMHGAVYFIKPAFSKIASAPTKLAELLATGTPILTNAGIGDSEAIILNGGAPVGVVINDLGRASLTRGINELLSLMLDETTASRCRSVAEERFSVDRGVDLYSDLYNELAVKGVH